MLPNQGLWAQEADTTAVRYTLEVLQAEARQPGLVRYEIHVLLPDSDRVSAVYGTDTHPLELLAPKGVFNSPYNGSWSSSGMNPKFFELMPDMQDDTYATIGLRTSAKLSGMMRAEDPTMVQDPSEPWDDFFTVNGETSLEVSTHTGGSWFVLRTAANGAPVDGEGDAGPNHDVWKRVWGDEPPDFSFRAGRRATQGPVRVRWTRTF